MQPLVTFVPTGLHDVTKPLQGFWTLNGLFVSSAAFACMEPLGMESGEISSEQISASSQYNSNWSPERSRLNYQENGWTPSDDTVREWIQVSPGWRFWFYWAWNHVAPLLISESELTVCVSSFAWRSSSSPTWLYRWELAHIWSEYCSLICTSSLHIRGTQKEKKWANMHYLLICLSSTVDISHLHCKIWHTGNSVWK